MIAIGGLKNAGKDTMAKMLQYCLSTPKFMHNYKLYSWFGKFIKPKYRIESFAHYLKTSLAEVIGVKADRFNDRDFKENYYIYFPTLDITNIPPKHKTMSDKKVSRNLQAGNMSFINDFYISIRQLLQLWGTECIRKTFGDKIWIMRTMKSNDKMIISDLRFNAEYESIKQNNGITIYIDRNCTPGSHPSEREVVELYENNQFDYIIKNDGSLKDLFNKTKNLVKLWRQVQK